MGLTFYSRKYFASRSEIKKYIYYKLLRENLTDLIMVRLVYEHTHSVLRFFLDYQ